MADAATDAAAKGKGAAMWLVNQFHPFGANGRLGRTIAFTTCVAGIGVCGAFAGAALPFATTITSATALGAGTAGTAGVQAAAAGAVAKFSATSGFWPTVGAGAAEYGAHFVNGLAYAGNGAIGVIKNGDFPAFFEAMGQAGNALVPEAA